MAKLRHVSVGGQLAQTEWESEAIHAIGDIVFESDTNAIAWSDIVLSRIAANILGLAAGDSFRIPSDGRLELGSTDRLLDITGIHAESGAGILLQPHVGINGMSYLALRPRGTGDRTQISLFNGDDPNNYAAFSIEINGSKCGMIFENLGNPTIPVSEFWINNTWMTETFLPKINNMHDLGSTSKKYANIWATVLHGDSLDVPNVSYIQGARVYHDVDQAIPTATWTVIAFNSELYDTDTIHDNSTNNSRLTCKTPGVYAITGHFTLEGNATGIRSVYIRLNGVTSIAEYGTNNVNTSPAFAWIGSLATIYKLNVNDYVELIIRQTSGVNLALGAYGNASPHFAMQRIG